MNYVMNTLIILLIIFITPALLFHLSYQLALFRASVLVNQSHTMFLNSAISNLISKSSSSHSSDPINLAAFKKLNHTLSPYNLDIIIISLNYGIFPTLFKHSIITPILKKPLLDPNIIANYPSFHNFRS